MLHINNFYEHKIFDLHQETVRGKKKRIQVYCSTSVYPVKKSKPLLVDSHTIINFHDNFWNKYPYGKSIKESHSVILRLMQQYLDNFHIIHTYTKCCANKCFLHATRNQRLHCIVEKKGTTDNSSVNSYKVGAV